MCIFAVLNKISMNENNTLLSKDFIEVERKCTELLPFIDYLNQLEGAKMRVKNLHWSAANLSNHKLLDKLHKDLCEHQDKIAEGAMGVHEQLPYDALVGSRSSAITATQLLCEVKEQVMNFYNVLGGLVCYMGIRSELESFILTLDKYKYLFNLSIGNFGLYNKI